MKGFKKIKGLGILPLFTAGMMALFVSGCGDDAQSPPSGKQGVLTMGTSADMPPFEFYKTGDRDTQIVGFDVEVARAIAENLGLELKIKDQDFSTLIPALQAGRVDFVMAAMTPTKDRLKSVDFSDSYLSLPVAAIANNQQKFSTSKELKNKRIGVQLGSTHEQVARDLKKSYDTVTVVSLNKLGELIQELLAGRIDVVLMETTSALSFQEAHKQLVVSKLQDQNIQMAIAFAKGSPWKEKFNATIHHLRKNKTLEALQKKWLKEH